uniref:Uncharacterized protein n=1 Tax=uncultured Thiotrichaceae bacterium TaxID=298394 RepID=A0A6S6SGY2_9GAMM|nr:MAG: Unknown protein [uncultured Thiotrichaceae bacterium]
MPKLVMKQNVGVADRKARQDKWLSLGGLLLLVVAVAGTAYFFTRPVVVTSPVQGALLLDSAENAEVKSRYLSMHNVFNELASDYERTSAQGLDDYQKNTQLFDQSEEILAHLDEMNILADQLGLSNDEYKRLFNRHQFNKDYWQAKSHFRQLRISRFDAGGAVDAPVTQADVATEDKPKKFQFAKPPEGMELPEGFCDLNNPGSCKPEGNELQADLTEENLALPVEAPAEVADKPKKFQFAKPPEGMELPEGFCDLNNPGSCKPEASVSDNNLVLPEDVPAPDVVAAPRKFQFAKPPEGMALPEGFCDLSDPAASCKPGNDAQAAVDENSKITN